MNTKDIEAKSFLVGGAVRDTLLGHEPKDRDFVVVGVTPEEMTAAGFVPVGKEFPVFLHPKTREEFALARSERSTGRGHGDFEFFTEGVTLEQDLSRRDLTINAMALGSDGKLIDPFDGQSDLVGQNPIRLRHVNSDAFREDPLRILRVARFAARFRKTVVDHGLLVLMQKMVADGDLGHITPERVCGEFEKALGSVRPRRFFDVLDQCGALGSMFPEIARMHGVTQPPKHHPEGDVFVHTMLVLDVATEASADPVSRFAALTHDLGKGTTPKDLLPKHHGHEGRGVPLVEEMCDRLRMPVKFKEAGKQAAKFHTHIHRAKEMRPIKLVRLFESLRAFHNPETLERLLLVADADARGRGPTLRNKPHPNLGFVRDAFAAAKSVKPQLHLKGKAVGDRLEQDRAKAINAFKDSFLKS